MPRFGTRSLLPGDFENLDLIRESRRLFSNDDDYIKWMLDGRTREEIFYIRELIQMVELDEIDKEVLDNSNMFAAQNVLSKYKLPRKTWWEKFKDRCFKFFFPRAHRLMNGRK